MKKQLQGNFAEIAENWLQPILRKSEIKGDI